MRMFIVAAVAVLALTGGIAASQPADGLYTSAQADAGEVLYDEQCVSCHGTLSAFFPEMAALLGDHTFRQRWEGRSIGELFQLIQEEMPQDAPRQPVERRDREPRGLHPRRQPVPGRRHRALERPRGPERDSVRTLTDG